MPLLRATSSTLRSVVNGQDTPSMIIFFFQPWFTPP